MSETTITIAGRPVRIRELRMRTLREMYALPSDAALESMLLVLEGATDLKSEDLDEMTGIELKQLADAVKEANAPFLEMLKTMNSPEMAEGLSKIIDGIFYAPFLQSSAPATEPESGDTATQSF